MKKIGVLLSKGYRLLSIAAVLDVLQTVNKFTVADGIAAPFDILMLANDETIA